MKHGIQTGHRTSAHFGLLAMALLASSNPATATPDTAYDIQGNTDTGDKSALGNTANYGMGAATTIDSGGTELKHERYDGALSAGARNKAKGHRHEFGRRSLARTPHTRRNSPSLAAGRGALELN
jgi:hypothetical protein